jgi:hypothetical protein
MNRVVRLFTAGILLVPAGGCNGPGWYRAIGHIPGVAATDYAYYDFCGTSSQLYPLSPPQVQSSLIEALGDLDFKVLEPPVSSPLGEIFTHASAPDGRPTDIWVTPQNAMTNVRIQIGPVHIGDEQLLHELLRRISVNFGTVRRAYTPLETTLPRRINLTRGIPPQTQQVRSPRLEGEGLRPNESRDKAFSGDGTVPGPEGTPSSTPTGELSPYEGFVPTRDFPNPPYMPYAPFPYSPFNNIPQD